MAKICIVCDKNNLEFISKFRDKLDSILRLHRGVQATKDEPICRVCHEKVNALNLNETQQQPNQHNPKVLGDDGTVLDPQTKPVDPTRGSAFPVYVNVKTEPQSEDELETKPNISTLKVESNEPDGYVENTSEELSSGFAIKTENPDAPSEDNANEGNSQDIKAEEPFDNEDSDEINQDQFSFAEREMCMVRLTSLETNQRKIAEERPNECPHCFKTFITSTRLKEHKRTHTGERPYACSFCSKTYITAATLHIHRRTHLEEKPFVCSECGKSCTTSQLLKYHKRTHTGERPYACSYCPKSYIINSRLKRHMMSHRKEKREGPFKCLQCSKTFKSSWALKVHTRMHTQESNGSDSTQGSHPRIKIKQEVQDDEIDAKIRTTQSMETEGTDKPQDEKLSEEDSEILTAEFGTRKLSEELKMEVKVEDAPEAQSSDVGFFGVKTSPSFSEQKESSQNSDNNNKSNHSLKLNIKDEPKNEEHAPKGITQKLSIRMHKKEKLFLCCECGKRFLTTTKLQIHKRSHTGERPYRCDVCLKSFVSSYKLTEHSRIHVGDKPYECRFCSKTFLRSAEVQGHERTHTKEKPYICSECGKGFVTSSVLNRHKRTHTGVKPFVCSHCSKTFTSKFYLQTHIRYHTKENLFQCSDCGKSFITSKLLKDHKMTHTGERPYACRYCPKTYINRSGLINHTSSRMKEERKRKGPYECLECFKAFSNSCAYKVHALTHSKHRKTSDSTQTHTGTDSITDDETHLNQTEIAGAVDTNKTKEKLEMSESSEDVNVVDDFRDENTDICRYCSEIFHSKRDFRTHVRNHKKDFGS